MLGVTIGPIMLLGITTALAAIVGMSLGGWLADRLARTSPRALFLVPGVAMLASVPFILVAIYAEALAWIYAGIFLAEALMFINTGPCNAVIANVVAPNMRAAAYAVAIFVVHFLGDIWSPTLIGWVADFFGQTDSMATVLRPGAGGDRRRAGRTARPDAREPDGRHARGRPGGPHLGDRPPGRRPAPAPRDGPDARPAQGQAAGRRRHEVDRSTYHRRASHAL